MFSDSVYLVLEHKGEFSYISVSPEILWSIAPKNSFHLQRLFESTALWIPSPNVKFYI